MRILFRSRAGGPNPPDDVADRVYLKGDRSARRSDVRRWKSPSAGRLRPGTIPAPRRRRHRSRDGPADILGVDRRPARPRPAGPAGSAGRGIRSPKAAHQALRAEPPGRVGEAARPRIPGRHGSRTSHGPPRGLVTRRHLGEAPAAIRDAGTRPPSAAERGEEGSDLVLDPAGSPIVHLRPPGRSRRGEAAEPCAAARARLLGKAQLGSDPGTGPFGVAQERGRSALSAATSRPGSSRPRRRRGRCPERRRPAPLEQPLGGRAVHARLPPVAASAAGPSIEIGASAAAAPGARSWSDWLARKCAQEAIRNERNLPFARSTEASPPFSSSRAKKPCTMSRADSASSAADECVERIPVVAAEGGQRLAGLGRVAPASGEDHAPAGRLEIQRPGRVRVVVAAVVHRDALLIRVTAYLPVAALARSRSTSIQSCRNAGRSPAGSLTISVLVADAGEVRGRSFHCAGSARPSLGLGRADVECLHARSERTGATRGASRRSLAPATASGGSSLPRPDAARAAARAARGVLVPGIGGELGVLGDGLGVQPGGQEAWSDFS